MGSWKWKYEWTRSLQTFPIQEKSGENRLYDTCVCVTLNRILKHCPNDSFRKVFQIFAKRQIIVEKMTIMKKFTHNGHKHIELCLIYEENRLWRSCSGTGQDRVKGNLVFVKRLYTPIERKRNVLVCNYTHMRMSRKN